METDFLASGNHFAPIFQISFLLEAAFYISWRYILQESFITASGNGFSVFWEWYSFIHIFFEAIIAIRGRPMFKKILFLLLGTVFFNLFRHCFKWKQSFGPLKSYFSTNPSSQVVYADFGLISNSVPLFRAFFLLLESITEIMCKPVFFDFFSS